LPRNTRPGTASLTDDHPFYASREIAHKLKLADKGLQDKAQNSKNEQQSHNTANLQFVSRSHSKTGVLLGFPTGYTTH